MRRKVKVREELRMGREGTGYLGMELELVI
jgi:hypothetical protein